MLNFFKLKMLICKILTFWIIPAKNRKLVREFLFWFSLEDYLRFKNLNYYTVSLGNSCLSRVLLVSAGVKPRRFYGEKSCPFDLYFSTDINRTIQLIKNDFSDFFEHIDPAAFPHDNKLTVKQFKKRYQRRIQNFLEIQKSDKMVYYVYANYGEIPKKNDITKLYEVLKSKRGTKPFELIILSNRRIDAPNVIQIPYDIQIDDSRAIEFIINRYKDYNNKYTLFSDYIKGKFQEIIHP